MFDIEKCTKRILDTHLVVVNLTEKRLYYYCEGRLIEIESNDSPCITEKSTDKIFKICDTIVQILKRKYPKGIFIIVIPEYYRPYADYINFHRKWRGYLCDENGGKKFTSAAKFIDVIQDDIDTTDYRFIPSLIRNIKNEIQITYLSLMIVYLRIKANNKRDWKIIIAGIILLYLLIALFITSKI